jgi:hypothetical protein
MLNVTFNRNFNGFTNEDYSNSSISLVIYHDRNTKITQEDINEAIVKVPPNLIDSFYVNIHLDGTMGKYSILFIINVNTTLGLSEDRIFDSLECI